MPILQDGTLVSGENRSVRLAVTMNCGDREEQQDSCGFEMKSNDCFLILCDGMGGHRLGKEASSYMVSLALGRYKAQVLDLDPIEFLKDVTVIADKKISMMKDENGGTSNAGTTAVSILIQGNELYWNSVGDSRAYILRDGEFAQITFDHTYRTVLEKQLAVGQITRTEYNEGSSKANMLVNYIGIGDLELMDYNDKPFEIVKGDRILVTSDGLYRVLSESEIRNELMQDAPLKKIMEDLNKEIYMKAKESSYKRDNTTMALIEIKGDEK